MLRRTLAPAGFGLAALAAAGACADGSDSADEPRYLGVETRLLDGDLVNFRVGMRGAGGIADIETYARCAAAQYAAIRGYGFARHLRTNVTEEGGVWRADAVYTISPTLPQGLRTIDAEVTVAECERQEIPTV